MNISQLHHPNYCPNCGNIWSQTTVCDECSFQWKEEHKLDQTKPTKMAPKPTSSAPKPKGPAPQHLPSKPTSSAPQPSKPSSAPPKPSNAPPKSAPPKPQRKCSPRIDAEEQHVKKTTTAKKKPIEKKVTLHKSVQVDEFGDFLCCSCGRAIFDNNGVKADGYVFHKNCLTCEYCGIILGGSRNPVLYEESFICEPCFYAYCPVCCVCEETIVGQYCYVGQNCYHKECYGTK